MIYFMFSMSDAQNAARELIEFWKRAKRERAKKVLRERVKK